MPPLSGIVEADGKAAWVVERCDEASRSYRFRGSDLPRQLFEAVLRRCIAEACTTPWRA